MPNFIHLRVRRAICRVGAATCLAVLASAGPAFASCPDQPVSTPFSQWGDASNFFLVPGGSLEGSADDVGWTLSNATLTQGNEPFGANGSADNQSVTIDGGGSATTPYFCVDNSMASLRFFAQQAASGSDLHIDALIQTSHGVITRSIGGLADGSMPSWAPTGPIDGGAGALPAGRTVMVALRFAVPSSDGSWQLDDIYVDPYRSG